MICQDGERKGRKLCDGWWKEEAQAGRSRSCSFPCKEALGVHAKVQYTAILVCLISELYASTNDGLLAVLMMISGR